MCIRFLFLIFAALKRIAVYPLVWVAVLIVAGCDRQQTYNRVLSEVDIMIEQDADSAYALLQDITEAATDGDEAVRAHYMLLTAQACYKLYKPVPADSLLAKTVRYYEQTANRPVFCRAIYYRAMPLYEQGQHAEALLLLKKGEELATEIADTLYMSKYHESLCMVNYAAHCNDLMLKYAKLFLDDAISLHDAALISRAYSHISTAYTRLGDNSEAEEYMLKSLPYLENIGDTVKSYLLTNVGCTYHKANNLATAKQYLEQSLKIYKRANTYAELGDVYADEGNMAEAESCWQKALSSDNPTIVLNTLTSIYRKYRNHGNDAKALGVLKQIDQLKDSLHEASEKKAILEIQGKYEKESIENKYYQAQTWIWRGAFLCFAVVMLILYFYRRSVKAYTTKLNNSYQTIQKIQQQITYLEDERARKIAEKENEKVLHDKEVASISQKYDRKIEQLKDKVDNVQREAFERIGLGRTIYRAALKNAPIRNRDDEKCLIEYYSVFHYDSYHKWMEEYEGLTVRYLVILILQEMGKQDSEIEQILIASSGALRTAKSRINAKKKS